jgi:hypothetical protein
VVERARVAFATKHHKGELVAPALATVGLVVHEVEVDTDRFGTFTRTIPRAGDQREAARRKCDAAFECDPSAGWALASEGAFGPWPSLPWIAQGRELLLLRSRDGAEIAALDVTLENAFAHAIVTSADEARELAERVGFPEQALFVATPPPGFAPSTEDVVASHEHALVDAVSIDTWDGLLRAIEARFAAGERVWLEADLRAHRSPLRRQSLRRAATRLAEAFGARCPSCAHPGFAVHRFGGHAPCEACDGPTELPRFAYRRCPACGFEAEELAHRAAPAARCPYCNP